MNTLHKASKRKFGLLVVITCLQIISPAFLQERGLLSAELCSKFSETSWTNSRQGSNAFSNGSQTISNFTIKWVTAFDSFIANSEMSIQQDAAEQEKSSDQGSYNSDGDSQERLDDLVHVLIVLWLFVSGWWLAGLPPFTFGASKRSDSYKREDER